MGNAEEFDDFIASLSYEEYAEYMLGLTRLKMSGMTYKALGGLTSFSPHVLAKRLKPFEREYEATCTKNFHKITASLKRNDPEYDYMTDPRTVTQQMCALLMGGEEIRSTLEQLSNWNETNDATH